MLFVKYEKYSSLRGNVTLNGAFAIFSRIFYPVKGVQKRYTEIVGLTKKYIFAPRHFQIAYFYGTILERINIFII